MTPSFFPKTEECDWLLNIGKMLLAVFREVWGLFLFQNFGLFKTNYWKP